MNNSAIQCHALSKSYDDGVAKIDVLMGVDLNVQPDEMVAIVGNSGSGKSTLLHLLGGLDQPTAGEIIIAGKNLLQMTEKEKCHCRNLDLGFIYQFHHLLPEFTALENVSMPLLIQSIAPDEAESKAEMLLTLVGLRNRLQHKMGQLSGGERQRVAIARALVNNPKCILADEPTGNLDPKNADKVFELFLELQKTRHTSVIMVTHDYQLAAKADRILLLEQGKLTNADVETSTS